MDYIKKKNFCRMPFSHLAIEGQGDVKACCLAPAFKDNEGGAFNLNRRDLSEINNCKDYLSFKESFLEGQRHHYCQQCWDADDQGLTSLRKTFSEIVENYGYEEGSSDLIFMEIKMGLKCNLRCGICNPENSSKWAKLLSEIDGDRKAEAKELLRLSRWVELDQFYKPENFSKIRLFHIMGGEPFLVPQNERFLDMIIKHGNPEETTLWYNTNATVVPHNLVDRLNKFKKVKITLSVDDIGRRFEFQRYPAKWQTIESNFIKFSELVSESIQVKIDVCWSLLNSFYIDEIIETLEPVDSKMFKLDWPNLAHRTHHYAGDELALYAMESHQREKYLEKLDWVQKNFSPDYKNLLSELKIKINSLPVDSATVDRRKNKIAFLEKHQKMSFKDVFPELYEVIN